MKTFLTVWLLFGSLASAKIDIHRPTSFLYEGHVDGLMVLKAADEDCKEQFLSRPVTQHNLSRRHKIASVEIKSKFGKTYIKVRFDKYSSMASDSLEYNQGFDDFCSEKEGGTKQQVAQASGSKTK